MPEPTSLREKYNEAFSQLLAGLNPRQREAVNHIEGPVLVLAGPGTGKTHILAARIGRILLDTDAAPYNILCLTFTTAGVRAMRDRLLRFIGPEAHRVHIHTFHSFCQQVIQDNLEYFGYRDLQPLSELERLQLVRELIDELDVDNPLKRGRNDAYYYQPHLDNLFSQMKREDWTVENIGKAIDRYLTDLPSREAFTYKRGNRKLGRKKGDPKVEKIEEEARRMALLREGARLFDRFQEKLREKRRYDYEDMILKVLRAFERNTALLRRYQEQYLYFLVDEFQDTNGAQYEVLDKLAAYWETPNIFIVGDDDQSIYEFQGARLHNLTDFFHRYREAVKVVVLEDNYRSTQPILDAARSLIEHNEIRLIHQMRELDLKKALTARKEPPAPARKPLFTRYSTRLEEIADLCMRIQELIGEGVPAEEIAVIYAKHRQAERLIELFDKKQIPFHTRRNADLLTLPLIDQLRTMLTFVDRETRSPGSADAQLFRMFHFRFFGIDPLDIAHVSIYFRGLKEAEEALSLRTFLGEAITALGPKLRAPEALLQLQELLDSWIGQRFEMGLPAHAEWMINSSGMLSSAVQAEDAPRQLAALKTFMDYLKAECHRDPRLSLRDLLTHLDLMEENRLQLPVDQEAGTGEGVELVTAHSAKGLEFDHVFLLDAEQRAWEPGSGTGRYRFSLPDTLTFSGEEDAMEARRRLFYVAMTRARHGLYLSCAEQNADGKSLQPCRFVDELLADGQLDSEARTLSSADLQDVQFIYLQSRQKPRIARLPEAALRQLVDDFSLSISALNTYLRCPVRFYYEYLLKVPATSSEPALYGHAIHEAMQVLFEQMLRRPERLFPPREQLLRSFEDSMQRRRAFFSESTFDRWLEMGRRDLSAYYLEKSAGWPREALVEKGVWRVELEEVPITGFIDRVDLLDRHAVRLIDYKTGTSESGKDYRRRPTGTNPEGGAHWRQMVFYKILFERSDIAGRQVQETVISYLEADKDGTRRDEAIEIRPGDTDLMRAMIQEVYGRIQSLDFDEGCGDTRCPWCTFVRRYAAAPIRLADPELESLDDKATS